MACRVIPLWEPSLLFSIANNPVQISRNISAADARNSTYITCPLATMLYVSITLFHQWPYCLATSKTLTKRYFRLVQSEFPQVYCLKLLFKWDWFLCKKQRESFSEHSEKYLTVQVLITVQLTFSAFSALTLLVGRQEGHPVCKGWGTGVVICLKRGANDLHVVHLVLLPPHHLLRL